MRWLLAGVFLVLAAAATALSWLVGTEAGLHWAAARVPGLESRGLSGRLAGEVHADEVTYTGTDVTVTVKDLSLRAHLAALLGGRLTIDPLRATTIEVDLKDEQEKEGQTKRDLPVRIHVANVQVDAIELRRGASRYRVEDVRLEHARLGRDVSLSGSLYWPDERFATRAKMDLRGSLERIEAHIAAEVAGTPAEARAIVTPSLPQKLESIEVRAGPIDLARFDGPNTALSAAVKGEMSAGGALGGAVTLENTLAGPLDAERLPFTRLEARFLTDFVSARLDAMRVALPGGGTVQGEATLAPGSVHAKLVAAAVNLRGLHSRLRETKLHGPLQIQVDGKRQWARGSLTQEGIGLTAEIVRNGETLEVRELRALADGGEVSGTGTVTLASAMPFTANVAVKDFDPAALGDYPSGSLSGSLVASGQLAPRDMHVKWSLGRSELYGHTFRSDGAARLIGERVTQADADIRLGANRLSARGAYGRPGDELAVSLEAPRLEEFTPVAGSLRARATLSGLLDNPHAVLTAEAQALGVAEGIELEKVTMKLSGTLTAHDAQISLQAPQYALDIASQLRGGWSARGWIGQVRSLRNSGAYPLELVAPAPLRVTPGQIELGRLEARLADEGRILVREAAWTRSRMSSSGEFERLPAQWVILAAGLGERLQATLRVDGEWELTKAKELEGRVRMRRSDGDLALVGERAIDLGLESASLDLRLAEGRASGEARAASRVARLLLQGQVIPALEVQGKIEFAELGTLTRPFLQEARLDGRLFAELRASGTLAAPQIHGTLSGEALAFELPLYGVALKDGTLKAVLEGESLKLESLSARGGEGRFEASGNLPLGLAGTARIAWRAKTLSLLERPDMRLVVSGEGEANYDGKLVSLTGDLRADRGHFEFARDRLPKLGDDVVVLGDTTLQRRKPPARMRLPVALDVRVDLGNNLVVQGYGYDGRVTGLVDIATTKEGELRAFGRVQTLHATFLAYGQRLDVDPGVLIFDGPIDNPALQITAWRRNQAVQAGVQITGTARAPSVNLVSQPPVPEGERLSWLVLGRPPSGATQADLGLLQAAAGALLAGGDSVPLDRRIARRFGLDELTLRGSGELTDRAVAVGKRLSDRIYISYEQGLGAVATSLIKLDYALGRRWTLRAETGTTSGGGLFYRYSWD